MRSRKRSSWFGLTRVDSEAPFHQALDRPKPDRGVSIATPDLLRLDPPQKTEASPPSPTAPGRHARTSARRAASRQRRLRTLGASAIPSRHPQTRPAPHRTSYLPHLTGAPTMPAGPCTGARWRKLPTGHPSLAERRGTSPFQVLETQGPLGGSRRPARLREIYPRLKSFRKVQGPRGHLKWDPLSTRKQRSPGMIEVARHGRLVDRARRTRR